MQPTAYYPLPTTHCILPTGKYTPTKACPPTLKPKLQLSWPKPFYVLPLHTLTLFGWHANEQWNRKCCKIHFQTWPLLFNLAKSFALKLKLGFKFCQFSGRSGNSGLPPSHQPSVDLRISLYLASAYICICVFVFLYFPRIRSENSGSHPPSPVPATRPPPARYETEFWNGPRLLGLATNNYPPRSILCKNFYNLAYFLILF